jgi:hypothetical protein
MRIVELDTVLVQSGDRPRHRSVPGGSDAVAVERRMASAIEC